MAEFYVACLIAMILVVWLKTDALVEWGSVFGLSKILKTKEYYKYKLEQSFISPPIVSITYPTFLKLSYNSFFTRLISCPMCLSFWFSVVGCLSICSLLSIPIVYVLSLLIYGTIAKLVINQ